MLEAELQRLRDYNTGIAGLLEEVERHLAQPLVSEPSYHVMSEVNALPDRVYEMALVVGDIDTSVVLQPCHWLPIPPEPDPEG